MVVLAIETATREGSLAVEIDGACDARAGDGARTHGERLPGEAIALLAEHGRTLRDVTRLAVIAGPGSFTGLRVGMAAVQGLALPAGLHVVPVPTLDAMADAWIAGHDLHGLRDRLLLVACLDGQRGDVFFAAWEAGGGHRGRGAMVIEPRVGRPDDLVSWLEHARPDMPVVLAGNGGPRYRDVFQRLSPMPRFDDLPRTLAEIAARTAAAHPERAVAPHALRPIYIRRPDAELARERSRQAAAQLVATADAVHVTDATIVRVTSVDDLSEVERLQRRAFTNAWGAEAIRWELANSGVARLYAMRAPDGALVAYCACWLLFDELHLNSVAVDESQRRRGLARRLLRHVFRDTVAGGATSATLEVRESNTAARALYEGLGFRVEAVRREYYNNPREDGLILWNRRLVDQTGGD